MTGNEMFTEYKPENSANSNDSGRQTPLRFSLLQFFQKSQTVKVILIGILILLLQIPILKIVGVIKERQMRSFEAASEIAVKWGREQKILGPIVTIPFVVKSVVKERDLRGEFINREIVSHKVAHFLAEELKISAQTENTTRYRGIFETPVYRADITLSGNFKKPDFSKFNIEPTEIFWDRATFSILISDPRTIAKKVFLKWNNKELPFQPGSMEIGSNQKGIAVPLKGLMEGRNFSFTTKLVLQGSSGLFFAPMGGSTTATVSSNWPHPSFQGEWLPIEHATGGEGFQANWQISSLGSQYEQQWLESGKDNRNFGCHLFGVNFVEPVDTYRMAERSVKYQFLFLSLIFLSLWLVEILAKIRLHALHYLLVGSGMCLFYLLELSLAEHMGFMMAYFLAASSIVGLISCYCLAILKSPRRSVIIGGFITFMYSYLYTLLVNQDYALLAGSLALFVLLAAVMYLTRNVDWSALRM